MIDREKLITAYMKEYSMSQEAAEQKADETLQKLAQLYPEEFHEEDEDDEEAIFWDVSEVMCCKCFERWIAVRPSSTLLKNIECPRCKFTGAAVETGQEFDFEFYDDEDDDEDSGQVNNQ